MEVVERAVETAICELLSFVVISVQAKGGVPNMEASMCKMYGSELSQRLAWTEMHVTGLRGQLRKPVGLEGETGIRSAMNYMSTVPATIAACSAWVSAIGGTPNSRSSRRVSSS